MTLAATINLDVEAQETATSGLTTAVSLHPLRFAVGVGDCSVVWSEKRTVGADGHDDVDIAASGVSVVKLFCVKNLSTDTAIALGAGYSGVDFRNFLADATAWNFSPMINLGSLTLRGYPIRPNGVFLLACPNSDGFSTLSGGSTIRIGGPAGAQYQIYVMGT